MEEKIKKINELRDRIRRQLLLRFYLTQDEEILFLLKRL
jgi:hypothetical protein